MTQGDARGLAGRLAREVQALVSRQCALLVTALTDGAPEFHALLDEEVSAHAPASETVVHLLGFWHQMEKLGAAALVVAGEAHSSALWEQWKVLLLNAPRAVWALVSALHASGRRNVVLSATVGWCTRRSPTRRTTASGCITPRREPEDSPLTTAT